MTLYIINFFLILIYFVICLLLKHKKNYKKIELFFLILSFFQLVFVLGTRNINVGYDTSSYVSFFNMQGSWSFEKLMSHRFEFLFKILTFLLYRINRDYTFYLSSLSIISLLPVFYISRKYSKYPLLSILVYMAFGFYFINFSMLRQSISFGIVFLSYKYIQERKIIKFLLTIYIASLFHTSALFFIPSYFLYNFKFSYKNVFLLFIIEIVVFLNRLTIFNFIINNMYDNYSVVVSDSYNWMIMSFSILFIAFINYKKVITNTKLRILYTLPFLGATIMLFASVGNNVMRIANYYYIFIILLIPEFISNTRINKNRMAISFITIVLLILLYIYSLYVDNYGIVAYSFAF